MSDLSISTLLTGALLFFNIFLFGKFRLPALLKYYALSSFCLAALIFFFPSVVGEEHLDFLLVALSTLVIKVVFLPLLLLYFARKAGIILRLQSFLRPAPSYFVACIVTLLSVFVFSRTAIFSSVEFSFLLFVAIALILLGILMMILRRDLFSQIIGFLVMENGVALFTLVTIGSIPLLIELIFFVLISISVIIMATLTKDVQEMYGTQDTEKLRELID